MKRTACMAALAAAAEANVSVLDGLNVPKGQSGRN